MTVQGETNREDKAVEPVSLMCQPTTVRHSLINITDDLCVLHIRYEHLALNH